MTPGAAAAREVLAALKSGDPRRVLGAIIAAPAAVAHGILNGHSGFTGLLELGGPIGVDIAPTSGRLLTLDLQADSGLRSSLSPPARSIGLGCSARTPTTELAVRPG